MASLGPLAVPSSAETWGPSASFVPDNNPSRPFAPYLKTDKLGRICDTQLLSRGRDAHRRGRDGGVFSYGDGDDGFITVDSSAKVRVQGPNFGARRNFQPRQQRRDRDRYESIGGQQNRGQQPQRRRGGNWNDRRSWAPRNANKQRNSSVEVLPTWKNIKELGLPQLANLSLDLQDSGEELRAVGTVGYYDLALDAIKPRTAKQLRKCSTAAVASQADEDPTLIGLAEAGQGDVFATDAVISQLMACPKAVYSFDITVLRRANTIFLTSRGESSCCRQTINETAHDAPEDDPQSTSINSQQALDKEATLTQAGIVEQAIKGEDSKLGPAHSFGDDVKRGYVYKRWTLPSVSLEDDGDEDAANKKPIRLVVRCEVDGMVGRPGNRSRLALRAINEIDPRAKDGVDWRAKLDSQGGAVLASALKNNSNRMLRFAFHAMMSDAKHVRVAFVSRTNPKSNENHQLLGVRQFKSTEYIQQVQANPKNAWGIIQAVCSVVSGLGIGSYCLLKEPNQATMSVYNMLEE